MAVPSEIHTQLRFLGFLLTSPFMRLVWGSLDWLFLLINWTKRKVLKDKPRIYSNEYDAVFTFKRLLRFKLAEVKLTEPK